MMEGTQPEECPISPGVSEGDPTPCALGDVSTGAKYIRMIQQCSRCGWVNPVALDGWAEQAAKEMLPAAAQRTALAASGSTFAFVQTRGQVLSLREAVSQALAAANLLEVPPDPAAASRILNQLMAFIDETYSAT